MIQKFTSSKGPKLGLEIEAKGATLKSVRLFLSDMFVANGVTEELAFWLHAYISKQSPPFSLLAGENFQKKVLNALQLVPFGTTVSYKELAALVNAPLGARAVGNALNQNPFPLFIPCHRVIYTNGKIGGFRLDLEIKKRLLEFEMSSS